MADVQRDAVFQNMAERFGFDLTALWPRDQHHDPALWLTDHGWAVSTTPATTVAQQYGRPPDETTPRPMQARREAAVWIAFVSRAIVEPRLADPLRQAGQRSCRVIAEQIRTQPDGDSCGAVDPDLAAHGACLPLSTA
jgi:hypothetical protein